MSFPATGFASSYSPVPVATPTPGASPDGPAVGTPAGPETLYTDGARPHTVSAEARATPLGATPGRLGAGVVSQRRAALERVILEQYPSASASRATAAAAGPSVQALREAYTKAVVDVRRESPITTRSYGLVQKFDIREGKSVGGATGSVRVKADGLNYQLKRHVAYATAKQKLAAEWSNVQNYGEVIGASVARSLVGQSGPRPRDGMAAAKPESKATARAAGSRGADPQLAPDVTLMHDADQHETAAVSLYLKDGRGDIDHHYAKHCGPLPADRKHVRLDFSAGSGPVPPGTLRLQGEAARDVQRHVAAAALLGDHDINTGNLIMVGPPGAAPDGTAGEGGAQLRVGRIDFGHAFNHLIQGVGGRLVGGGGVRDGSGNRILDFFNRERVRGNPLDRSSGVSKLWRDYAGLVPSHAFAAMLAEMAGTEAAALDDGIAQAQAQFTDLVKDLLLDGSAAAHREIDDIVSCLQTIAGNLGAQVESTGAVEIVQEVMGAIRAFVEDGCGQMKEVAKLCELQALIDDALSMDADYAAPASGPQREALESAFRAVAGTEGRAGAASPRITWLKTSQGQPAFTGTLDAYMARRQRELQAAATQAARDAPRLAFEAGLHRLQGEVEDIATRPGPQRVLKTDLDRLQARYDELLKLPGSPRAGRRGITWIALGKEKRGFEGDLVAYLGHRFQVAARAAG